MKVKKDSDGNIILEMSLLRKIPLLSLIVFSLVTAGMIIYNTANGVTFSPETSVIRVIICVAIFVFSTVTYFKRDRFILTEDKIVCYGKWEAYYSNIESVTVYQKLLSRFVDIQTSDGEFLVMQSDININVEDLAKALSASADNSKKRR